MGLADFIKVYRFLRGIRYPATKQQLMDQARGKLPGRRGGTEVAAGNAGGRIQRTGRREPDHRGEVRASAG